MNVVPGETQLTNKFYNIVANGFSTTGPSGPRGQTGATGPGGVGPVVSTYKLTFYGFSGYSGTGSIQKFTSVSWNYCVNIPPNVISPNIATTNVEICPPLGTTFPCSVLDFSTGKILKTYIIFNFWGGNIATTDLPPLPQGGTAFLTFSYTL